MNFSNPKQNFNDWFTQQWVILRGRKIDPAQYSWLIGPIGGINGIGDAYIEQLAEKENLVINRNTESKGLLASIQVLDLPGDELSRISNKVIDFYERTTNYKLGFAAHWSPFFKPFAFLVNLIFGRRLRQLNIPTNNRVASQSLLSEIITLHTPDTNELKYTFWLRKFRETDEVLYSGIYETCRLPSGITCVKAIFPLPNGSATVIMKPSVYADNGLLLDATGKKIGDPGFYFLLKDASGNYWTRYIASFANRLIISESDSTLSARQTLHLWKQQVVCFDYTIQDV